MKPYIITLIIVFCFTCWLADTGGPPFPVETAVKNISETSAGTRAQDMMIPNFSLTEQSRSVSYRTTVEDRDSNGDNNSPIGVR